MNQDRLMKLVPAGVVLVVAVFLGLAQMTVNDYKLIETVVGYGAATALMVLAANDCRTRMVRRRNR